MLTISNAIKGAVSGRYYTEDARDDYYVNRINEPGRWLGKGAELLGLSGKIQGNSFKICWTVSRRTDHPPWCKTPAARSVSADGI